MMPRVGAEQGVAEICVLDAIPLDRIQDPAGIGTRDAGQTEQRRQLRRDGLGRAAVESLQHVDRLLQDGRGDNQVHPAGSGGTKQLRRGGRLRGIDYENKLSSAQVKSALLFAGLYADGKTRIRETVSSRDHTERLFAMAGVSLKREGEWIEVERVDRLKPSRAEIPGDISAAAFFIVGAAMKPGSHLVVEKVCLNPTRTGLLKVLERMGARLTCQQSQEQPEPIGSIVVEGRRLHGTRITKEEIPSLVDELPILMTAMALAEGESLVSGAEELRVKETDRIRSMVQNLNAVGGQLQELPDGCLIRGVEGFRGGKISSFGDHRTAMSLAIATLAMEGELVIEDTDCVGTSFPSFFQEFERLKGLRPIDVKIEEGRLQDELITDRD